MKAFCPCEVQKFSLLHSARSHRTVHLLGIERLTLPVLVASLLYDGSMKTQQNSISLRGAFPAFLLSCLVGLSGCSSTNIKTSGSGSASLVTIAVTGSKSSVTVGDTEQLTATGTYSDKSTKDLTSSVQWSASPASAVTITSAGLLTANSSGTVSITATLSSVTGSLSLQIDPKLVSIAITPPTATIAHSTQQQFTATGTYSDGSTRNITTILAWTSSKPSVATISSNPPTSGLAAGISAGNTTITASSGNVSGTASLTVTNANASSLTLSPKPTSIALFVSQQFTATATFNDGTTQDVSNVATWLSSASANASVTATGLVTTKVANTSVTITATFESKSDSDTFTINTSSVNSISISPSGPIAQGTKIQFTATGTFNDGSTHDLTPQVTWSSSDTSTVNFISGSTAQGLKPGSVAITATLTSQSGTTTGTLPSFTITDGIIQSIAVTPANPSVAIGAHVNFTATGSFLDSQGISSTQDITTSAQWFSSDPSIATVGTSGSSYGVATGVASSASPVTITANFNTVSGSEPLTVTGQTLRSIAITPSSSVLALGSTKQYTAIGTYSDGTNQTTQPITQGVTWSLSPSGTNVVTITPSGAVTGNSPGTATINAQVGSLTPGTASVAVESTPLVCIEVTPPGVSPTSNCSQFTAQTVSVPATIQLSLTTWGVFQDGTTLDLTSSSNWTSSNASAATVGNGAANGGIVTGMAPGTTTTISASFSGQTGTATVNVTSATLVSIIVSPSSATIPLGSSQQFTAIGNFTSGPPISITNQVTWNSTTPSVAVIKSTGNAFSASRGTTGITASLDGVTSTPVNLMVQ